MTLSLPNFVPGDGPLDAKLVVIGEAPGYYEDRERRPFVGQSGVLLDHCLSTAGIDRREVYATNVVKYRPPNNKFKDLGLIGVDVSVCIRALNEELSTIRKNGGLNCILGLGNIPLVSLTGKDKITKWRGSILETMQGYKYVGALHPANFVPGPDGYTRFPAQAKAYTQLDINRAVAQSRFPEIRHHHHDIRIARRSIDVYRFFQECEKHRDPLGRILVAVDIESSRCIPCYIAFAYDEHNAMSMPLANIVGVKNPDGISSAEQLDIIEQVAVFLDRSDVFVIGQNLKYDHERLLNSLMIKVRNVLYDTALASHTIYPEFPKKLAFIQSIYTELPFHKDEGKDLSFIVKERRKKDGTITRSKVVDKDKIQIYNGKDVISAYAVYRAQQNELREYNLENFYTDHVIKLHNFYRKMESRGFKVNEARRLELIVKYLRWSDEIAKELKELCGHPVNCSDNRKGGQVYNLIYKELEFKVGKDVKEETLVMLIANHASHDKDERRRRILFLISLKRRVDKTISTYLLSPPDYDGRMRTIFRIAVTEEGKSGGTETGRTSTSVLKSPIRPEQMGMAFQTITKHGDVGSDIRSILEADDGYVLVSTDKKQAEMRVALHLAEDPSTLEKLDKPGFDYHNYTAQIAFGVPMNKVTKKDPIRHVAKTSRYLSLYDGQKNRLMNQVMSDMFRFGIDYHISEWKCGQVLNLIHGDTPRIKGIFHKSVVACLEKDRTLINPFGRRRQFFADWNDSLFREAYPYLCSSTVKDDLTKAMLRIDARKPDTLFMEESHDAFTIMCKENEEEEYRAIIEEECQKPIDFSSCSLSRGELTIPCETKVGKNYGALE